MIRLVYSPDPFSPGKGREVADVPAEGKRLRELVAPWTGGGSAEGFVAMIDGDECDFDDVPADGAFVLVTRTAGGLETGVAYVLASLVVSTATGLISQALLPGVDEVEDPRETAPTYGFGGQIVSSRREGAPIALAYGKIRAGGQIINEFVENGRGATLSSSYAVQIAFGEGPIRSIGGLAEPTADGTILRTNIDTVGFLTGVLVDGNDASALSGAEAQTRLGYDEQSPASGFEYAGTPTPNGALLDAPSTAALAPSNGNIDPLTTSQSDQDDYWASYGEAVILPAGTYDAARVTVSFPNGAYIISGSAVGRIYLNLIVRYIELDGSGTPITTGGNFGDGWVRLPMELYAYQTRSPVALDFVFPFYDPATYSSPSVGGAIFFPADSTPPTPDLRIAEASVTKPVAWGSGNDVAELSVEFWVNVTTFNNGGGTNPGTQHMICGLYEFETHGWSVSIELKEFALAPGATVTRWVPVLRKHQGSTTVDYHENYVAGGTSDGIGEPTVEITAATWTHVAITYEGEFQPSKDRLRFYVDGQMIEELILDIDLDHADYDFAVGRFEEETVAINAEIDELIVYNRALTPQEVRTSYNFGEGMHHDAQTSMIFAYHFNGTATDFSGNGNDLTGSGGPTYTVSDVVNRPSGNLLKPGRYRVEVAKNNSKTTNVGARDVPELDSVTGLVDGGLSYAGSPVLSLKVAATEEINSTAPTVTSLIEGRLVPVWDGDSVTEPNFVRRYTRNLAWVVADWIITPRIALGRELGVTRIDPVSFQVLADFCDEWLTDGRGNFRESTNDGDADGWVDLRYDGTTVDAVTGELRGSISIRFAAFADIPDHWQVGKGVRFDGTPAVGGNMNLDVSYPNMDGFEIYFINDSDSLPFVNVYYDRLHLGEPWTGTAGSLASAIGAGNVTGTIEGAERRFTYDAFLDTAERGWERVIQTLSLARAVPLLDGDTVRVKIRRPRSVTGFVGMGNIIEGSFEVGYIGTSANANEITVHFKDEGRDYDQSTQSYLHPSIDTTDLSAVVTDDVSAVGITRRVQALRLAVYMTKLNVEVKRRGSFDVGPDGLKFEVGDLLAVSHDIVPWGVGGRVQYADAAGATSIRLDREITIESGTTAYVRVRNEANGKSRTIEVSQAAGVYAAGTPIALDAAIPFDVTRQTLYTFFHDGAEMVIDVVSIELDESLGAHVEWVEYVESVYDDDVDAVSALSSQATGSLAQVQQASNVIPGNVENLRVAELPPSANSEDDVPRVLVTWTRPASTPVAGGFAIWGERFGELPVLVAEVRGDATSAEIALPTVDAGEVYRVTVQQIAPGGARRDPEMCPSRAVRIERLGAKPAAPTNVRAVFAEDTVTYAWDLPANAPALVVEARAGGWSLGRVIFTSSRGDRSFGPTPNWSAGRITLRSMNAAGRYSDPVTLDLDTSDVDRNSDATDVDPVLGAIEWADYEDGWIDDSSHSSPKPVMVDLARDADGFLSFSGSSLTASYTTSDPTDGFTYGRTRREVYVEANCLAFEAIATTGDALTVPPDDPRAAILSGDGFSHNRAEFSSGVTLSVEARISRDGTSWGAWREFHPGLIQCVAVQFRITITRASTDFDVQIRSFKTGVAAKVASLYDVTPEDLFLRRELDFHG